MHRSVAAQDRPWAATSPSVLSIGHSTHEWPQFMALLRGANVTAIADVRTVPYSRRLPRFNREALQVGLREAGIAYVHLGKELGGRPTDPSLYRDGVVDYDRVAATPSFAAGLDRVIAGAARYRICLMCAERDPLHCHRCLLVSRRLHERDVAVDHLLADGSVVPHGAIATRLLAGLDGDHGDMFESPGDRLARAYRAYARTAAISVTEAPEV